MFARRLVVLGVIAVIATGCPKSNGGTGGGSGGGAGGGSGGGNGHPIAQLSAASVDFGALGCGAPATSKALTLTNTGTGTLTYTAAVSGTGFSVSPPSGSVEAGMSATLTVNATVPSSSAAGASLSGTLTVTTNDGAHASTDVSLAASARGVTLTLNPTVASFGVLPVGTQAPALPLTLTNTGNVAATLTVTQPTDTQFSLDWTGSPGAISVPPSMSAPGLQANFKPDKIMPSSASATLSVAEPVCGNSVSAVPMTGQGTGGQVGFSKTDVFFGTAGLVPCGTTASMQTFTINNSGNSAFSFTATLGKGMSSPFSFSPMSGTVPANNGSITLTVTTTGIPQQADTSADAFGDVLTFVTDAANDSPHLISLHQTAAGAVLVFVPQTIDFGLVPIMRDSSAPFTVENNGSAPATVTLASDNPAFTLNPSASTMIIAGGANPSTATFSPGASVVQQTANVTLTVDAADVLCAPLPPAMTMTGTGTNGSVSFTPAALDFGQVDCGATAQPQTITFTNGGNQDYTVTPVLQSGANFALSMSPDSGTVAQDGGTVVITITPNAIPAQSEVTPNLYGDTLTITTDVTGDSPHDVPIRETAHGSIFAISTNGLDFGSVAVGSTGTAQFTVSNNGNAAGQLSFTAGQPTIFALPQNATVNANTNALQSGSFSPQMSGNYNDTATITAGASTVLCKPLPFNMMSLTGKGVAMSVVALSAQSLTFGSGGLVPCGTTAAAQTVTVTNTSSQSLNLTYTLLGGSSSPYAVSGPAAVAAGATATVTVTPQAIPAAASTAVDAFADTLTIAAAGGPVSESHTVALHETAQGAVLSFNPTSLAFTAGVGATQSKNFTVNNTGNLAAPYTLTVGGTNANLFSVSPTSGNAAAGGSGSESATFSPGLNLGTKTATVSVSTSAGLCAPLPTPLAMTGN